jgi:hypothetical protein
MPTIQYAVAVISGLLLATLLLALIHRRRYRYGYFFTAYVVAQLVANVVYFLVPTAFADWASWGAKEIPYAILRLAILAETVALIFRVLPRAKARAQMLILIAVATLVGALSRPSDTTSPYWVVRDITSRFSYVTIWSLIAILALVAWYRVPLLRFHKAILHGLLWLLLASYATVIGAGRFGHDAMGLTYNLLQIVVLGVWIVVVLRNEVSGLGKDEAAVIRYLQPWRKP